MLDRRFRTAACGALALLIACAVPALADDQSFTVADVHEDVTAASALAAKEQAQAEGQAKAYNMLMERIAGGKAPHQTAAQIADLLVGFEVANERTSNVRYVADYTFHFNPAAIRRLLDSSSVAYVAPPKQVIVLPVLSGADGAVLWDDPNPWRDAWAQHGAVQAAMPLVVPVGDLPDVAAIDAPKAIAGDRAALKAISARYRNDDVVVAQGKMSQSPRRFEVTAARYVADSQGAPQTATVTIPAKPGESDADLMARAVAATIDRLGQAWKTANTVDPNTGGVIDATLAAGSLADWIAVRNRLRTIPAVRGTELLSFDRSQIRVAIRYLGEQGQFRAALGEHGLDLSGNDPDWVLALRPEPAPAPAPVPAETPKTPAAADKPAAGGDSGDPLRKGDE